jgi:hypothetical protein
MCFQKMPEPKKPPPPPNKLDSMNDALRNQQARRAGGTQRSDTNVTGLGVNQNRINTVSPMAGGKTILGG